MRKKLSFIVFIGITLLGNLPANAQDPPPNDANAVALSGNSNAADKLSNVPINYYTGMPSISIPLYAYSHHNGIALNISLDYADAGGVKVNEVPTVAGLGWYLNAGGVITRTVRGMPDDIANNGFLYSSAIPADYRPNGTKYYYDSLDAEQDLFEYNFNGRSGKFIIGKNKQIVPIPLNKLRVSYTTTGGNNTPIQSFTIIQEDGVKYVFNDAEMQTLGSTQYVAGYKGFAYGTAWYLSQIISPFGTDTVRFYYTAINESVPINCPQTKYVRVSDGVVANSFAPTATLSTVVKKLYAVSFPDKKVVKLLYDRFQKYDGTDSVLNKIEITDSIFRYGYLFNWSNIWGGDTIQTPRAFLHALQMYTANGTRPGYTFYYDGPWFSAFGTPRDTLTNKRDHWGYCNYANNGTNVVPSVPGIYSGADRSPNTFAGSSILHSIVDPTGGLTAYQFEPNDIYQVNTSQQTISINALNSTSTSVSLSQVYNNQYTFTFAFDPTFSRTGSPPFSGTCWY